MKFFSLVSVLFLRASALFAQPTATNESIIKMAKAGLSDDVIVATINAAPGSYDTSPDELAALKTAKVSDKAIAVIVQKNSAERLAASSDINFETRVTWIISTILIGGCLVCLWGTRR